MTLGQKLKDLRKRFCLSQEDLGDKLNVSRQTITKWENDEALPDTNNLSLVSRIYGITIDSLLDNKSNLPSVIYMKETIDLDNYDKGEYKDRYESILKTKFKDFSITPLMRNKKMNKLESIFDFFIGAGTVELADSLHDLSPYYLVEKNGIQLLVNIKKDLLTVTELLKPFNKKTYILDDNEFMKMNIKI